LDLDLEIPSVGRYRQHIPPHDTSSQTPRQVEDPLEAEESAFEPHYTLPASPIRPQVDSADPTAIPEGLGKPKRPRTLPILRVIGQIAATYIVAEGPAGMYLVDQHAAHERILFEQFLAEYHSRQITSQHTLGGEMVELSPIYSQLLEEYAPLLHEMGFTIEPFGIHKFRILSVPSMLADRDSPTVLKEMLHDIDADKRPAQQTLEEKILRHVCKAAAVKARQILSHDEMQGILRQLERCENPHTCPHGRPTMIHLSTAQLETQFGRK
jgi:DNA mismatch repair protein MutL